MQRDWFDAEAFFVETTSNFNGRWWTPVTANNERAATSSSILNHDSSCIPV
jgi:hypothetical protein